MTCPAHELAEGKRFHLPQDIDLLIKATQKTEGHVARDPLAVELGGSCRGGAGGGAGGTTACAVLGARDDVRLITVDEDAEAKHNIGQAVRNLGLSRRWANIHPEARHNLLTVGDIDLLAVDSHRTGYYYIQWLLGEWVQLVRPGGLVWVHDYGNPEPYGLRYRHAIGPARIVKRLTRAGELETLERRGISWLGRKTV